MIKKNLLALMLVALPIAANADYGICELDGAQTDSGESVHGECYMYSKEYGELDGAETDSGESVSGECYRYSRDYAEIDGAETESRESVSGECYFY